MSDINFTAMPNNPASFGLICDYLSNHVPFDSYEFGLMVKSIKFQLQNGTHLIGEENDKIVAYMGWLETRSDIAEAWAADKGPLHAVHGEEAVAVTVLTVSPSVRILDIVRAAKKAQPDKSVFWKRDYADNRGTTKRAVRKQTK